MEVSGSSRSRLSRETSDRQELVSSVSSDSCSGGRRFGFSGWFGVVVEAVCSSAIIIPVQHFELILEAGIQLAGALIVHFEDVVLLDALSKGSMFGDELRCMPEGYFGLMVCDALPHVLSIVVILEGR